ncbi:MAG: hypothetical protein IPK83_23240 [Planctomycetes bacterium]|nr:hypothetical protein [Planctomycetota bacterium]
MNLLDRDLFELYRLLLTTVCAIYFIVISVRIMYALAGGLLGSDRRVQVARNYIIVLLLRMRVASFKRELLAIGGYVFLLAGMLYWHLRI